ncbi:MAG: hypothetical protein ABJM58_03690 [Alteripontixanthobacter sp.]
MVDLTPDPATLGLSSPQLGAWFETSNSNSADLGPIPQPRESLACPVAIPIGAIWNAPANGTLSYFVAAADRPKALATLRQADGSAAFADDSMVLLFTLLPEVAQRLGALAQAAPRADSTAAATAGEMTRPVIDRIALEITPQIIGDVTELEAILPDLDSFDLKDIMGGLGNSGEKAAFVGLADDGGLKNAKRPATILRRAEADDRRLLQNDSAAELNVLLWAFDVRGRPYDAGSLAALWTDLADRQWDNLWASDDTARQRVAASTDGYIVHLVNAHEGPLDAPLAARITADPANLTDLTAIDTSQVLFTADANPAIAISAASDANTDTAPLARIAPLPAGPYSPLDSAAPFAGWADAGALTRDFLRVAITDIEAMTTGLARTANSTQADDRLRISPARNTADPLFLPTLDAISREAMDQFAIGSGNMQLIAPELDQFWGPQNARTPAGGDPFDPQWDDLRGADEVEDNPQFYTHQLVGSGSLTAGVAQDQSVIIRFDGSLPPGCWVRLWPHGRDVETGRRKRLTGAAALADAAGTALVALPLPDGTNGDGSSAVRFSFDALIVTDAGSRLYVDRRANRPACAPSGKVAIDALSPSQTIYCPQTGGLVAAATNAIPPGSKVFAVEGSLPSVTYTKIDPDSLRAEDVSDALANQAGVDDIIVTREPPFLKTPTGDLENGDSPNGAQLVHGGGFHSASIGQSMHDLAVYDTGNNTGLVGAAPGRDKYHEAPPAALGHPGVSAASEVHGEGTGFAGPAADQLRLIMRERAVDGLTGFITTMGTEIVPATAVTDPGPWSVLLETCKKGTHGHFLMGGIPASVEPGLIWDNPDPANLGIKQEIDAVLSSLPGPPTTDALTAGTNVVDSIAAAAFDRVLHKYRNGSQGFADAAIAAIGRAQDLVWLQTPAIDGEKFVRPGGDIELLEALTDRLTENKALHCLLILPAKHLPDRDLNLDKIRKSALKGALKTLKAAAKDRVVWVSPTAGPGRSLYMASTTLVVDDAVMLTGAAHGWRRGLTFDSALSTALFDELLENGRPRAVAEARAALAGAMLGIDADFVPHTAREMIEAAKALNAGGGFGRANPSTYSPKADPTSAADKEVWNPAVSAATDWTGLIGGLIGARP